MQKAKTENDVRGVQVSCINYIRCPLCYGCRNYSSADTECEECLKDRKNNICNTDKHQNDLIAKFISKTQIDLR